MLKVVFNEDGSINELIVMESINQGSNNVNKIFASILNRPNTDYTCVGEFELPSGDLEELSGVADTQYIGVNPYNGYTISLAETVTREAGNLKLNLKLIDLQDNVLCTYQVTLKVNKTGYEPSITHITEAQYNSLLQSLKSPYINGAVLKYFESYDLLPSEGALSTIYCVPSGTYDENYTYDEYTWNPTINEYIYFGTFVNTLDLDLSNYYTKQEVEELLNGKSKSYVINSLSDITGTQDSDGNFTNVTAITGVALSELKIGDIILIKQLDVADYWVSKLTPNIQLNKMETTKVDLLNGIYPIGSVYVSINNANPSTLFGGTWELLNNGLVKIPATKNVITGDRHQMGGGIDFKALTFKNTEGVNVTGSANIGIADGNMAYSAETFDGVMQVCPDNLEIDMRNALQLYFWKRVA